MILRSWMLKTLKSLVGDSAAVPTSGRQQRRRFSWPPVFLSRRPPPKAASARGAISFPQPGPLLLSHSLAFRFNGTAAVSVIRS
jgi:hypothetical protein